MKTGIKQVGVVIILLVVFSLGVAVAQAQDNRPRLRLINASLGAKNIDGYVGDTPVLSLTSGSSSVVHLRFV